jgi:putative DNA primase/helicase
MMIDSQVAAALREADQYRDPPNTGGRASSNLKPYDIADFLALEIPPREMILAPIIPEKGTVMLYAARGNGKTHVAHGIALAASTGTQFLKWTAPKPRRVLIIDGEMPASELQTRLSRILWGGTATPEPGMLSLLSADLVEGGIGNLADPKVQAALDPWLAGMELLILDNLSCLTAVIKDNDAESWGPIQEWLLRLRRRGISVLIVHHAGKGGGQRGTSRREDILDTSISLRRPVDYVAPEGARFEVHVEKGSTVMTPSRSRRGSSFVTASACGRCASSRMQNSLAYSLCMKTDCRCAK